MKIKHIIIAATSLLLANTHLQAAELKPYMGMGGGLFAIQYEETGPGYSVLQRTPTWGAFIKGGVDINPYLGAEVRLGTTGNPSQNWGAGTIANQALKVSTQIDSFTSILLKLSFPTSPDEKIHLYLGSTTAKMTVGVVAANGASTTSPWGSTTGFTYGLGYEATLSEASSIGFEWMEYWSKVNMDSTGGIPSIGSFRGLSFNFTQNF